MRLDYSEKMKAVRESAERAKPVQKNRPRREPIGTFAVVGLLLLVLGYGAGVLTGWFLFKGKVDAKALAAAQAAAQQKTQAAPAVQPATPAQPAQPGQPAPDVPLTFYKTLPSGGKGAMGSGINTKLPEVQSKAAAAAPAATAAPAPGTAPAKPAAAPAAKAPEAKPAEKAADRAEPAADKPAAADKQGAEARYLVQVASYKDKKEADAVRAKLVAKGVAAYLVESKLQDKGVWYRIRVGRHLSKQEALQLAGKVGSGATVVAE
ncbi:SPOR domain-containing protein [Geomonas sp. Red69]|uniref:SPOR domain-containing protein n=1 Tax=Geomonas diazotrophica TaxID=2843197 RepID=UPI001C127F05|nr:MULTISPECIES: SPOR domain-containing protein [Geomonas]MBU5637193.1 SPOR domain-containing protein [Geomonas diazotrophica]QXE88663.1 SPOR domain-containing protein [Geomonas nitrogeniifigens]